MRMRLCKGMECLSMPAIPFEVGVKLRDQEVKQWDGYYSLVVLLRRCTRSIASIPLYSCFSRNTLCYTNCVGKHKYLSIP